MLVIHGIWAHDALCLWAEDSRGPDQAPLPPGRRPSRAPRPHPFASDPDTLADVLAGLPEPFPGLARKAVEDELTLYLPATADGPQASPELIRRPGTGGGQPGAARVTLAPWRVATLIFEAAAALDLLAGLDMLAAQVDPAALDVTTPEPGPPEPGPPEPGPPEPGPPEPGRPELGRPELGRPELGRPEPGRPEPGQPDPATAAATVAGGSAIYWAAIAALAADLAGRGRVLPVLEAVDGGYAARWRPVLTGPDAQRARDLAAAMPPLCRAGQPTGEPPAPVFTAALDALCDAAARARLDRDRTGWTLLPARRGRRPAQIGVAERWTEALTGSDARVVVSSPDESAETAALARALADWHAAAQAPAGPVRTCFRLVEPEPDDAPAEPEPDEATAEPEPGDAAEARDVIRAAEEAVSGRRLWRVEFSLQSTDDPSLMIPADDIWAGTAGLPVGGIKHPEEELLAGLGAAARLFPELDTELRHAAPAVATLDTAGAFRFLKETGPLLSGAGFGVLLPDWARKARLGLKLTSRSSSTAGSASVKDAAFGLNDLVQFRYDLAVGDQALDPDELAELARLKIPLVRIRGQWVELDERNLKAAMRFLERHQSGAMRAGDALLAGLRGPEDDLPVTGIDADGWLGDLLSGQADRRLAPMGTPKSFRGTLRPYQERGVAWLSFLSSLGLGGILADDMGLGKCLGATSPIFINGSIITAEYAWIRFTENTWSDGEGEWAVPAVPLTTNALRQSGAAEVMGTASITRLYRQHVSEKLRKVRLDDGSEMLITRRHRLLGLHEWTREFAVGDRICVPARLEWRGQSVDPDLTTLLAWQISEGHEGEYSVCITQKDVAVLEFLRGHALRLGDSFQLRINRPSIAEPPSPRAAYLRITSTDYREFLKSLGYAWGKRSAQKRIPDFIVAADDDTIRRFMRGYFSAEGSVLAGMRSVEISSASPWLMQQLSCMLRRFGIWLRITEKYKRATNGSGIYRPYYIGLIGGSSLRRFHELVGFSDPVKQAKLTDLCATVSNTNVEGIPGSDVLALARHLTKLPMRHFGLKPVYFAGSQELSVSTAGTAVKAMGRILSGETAAEYAARPASRWTSQTLAAYDKLQSDDLGAMRDILAERASREVFYPRIVSVEDVDYTGWVYDFEVAEHHNFVAGGMLCHNTVQLLALMAHERTGQQSEPDAAQPETETGPAVAHELKGALPSRPTLLVCPMSLVGNWQREAERFTPHLAVHVHHGSDRLSGDGLRAALNAADLVITTYAIAVRDRDELAEITWGRVVCDEAQNIKNPGTRQARAVRSLPAGSRIALTGTPVENRLSELWSIMEFTSPGLLGPAEKFRTEFAIPVERHGDEEVSGRLRRLTGPFILRRVKTDKTIISDLPEKQEMKVWCNLTPEQASLYQATVTDMLARIEAAEEGIERRGLVLATMAKLKQVCNHPAHLLGDSSRLPGRSGKLARLEEICDEVVAAGERALCFTQYAEFGRMLQPHLAARLGCPVLFLHGGTAKKKRDTMVEEFQHLNEPAVFLLSLKAGGTGLNLTAANHVIHVDRWWNPAVEDQATDRAFRIGQRRDVQVRKFVCVGTLEERVDAMIEEKKALAEQVVGTGEGWLTELSVADLRTVLALSPEAVSQ
jgi:SNF2 family DNA or RNA helicase